MKKHPSLTLALLAFFALSFQSCYSSKEKQELVIYSPHGKDLLSEFEKLYESRNPNVDIHWLDMGSQEIFDRVSTESKNPQADIWWGAPSTMFMKAEKMGLLQVYKPSWALSIPAYAKSKNDCWFGTFATPEVIAFNENKFTAQTAPQDWNDIIKPEWKDKIVIRNPMASGTMRSIICSRIQQSIKETGNENDGWVWLSLLHQNTGVYAADPTQMYGKLGGSNEAVTLWNMPDIILQKNKYKFPFGYVFPSGGTVVLTDAIAILKGTKREKLARDFYEFVTSEQALILQAEKYYRIPARTDIPAEKLPVWLKNCNYKTLEIDWELISEKESEWMKKWDSEIKNN